jgi:hypothetical protein
MSGQTFLVERYLPGLGAAGLEALAARLTSAAAEVERDTSRPVRWLCSIALFGDETCLCVFSARTREDVEEANRRANAAFERIVPAAIAELQSRLA